MSATGSAIEINHSFLWHALNTGNGPFFERICDYVKYVTALGDDLYVVLMRHALDRFFLEAIYILLKDRKKVAIQLFYNRLDSLCSSSRLANPWVQKIAALLEKHQNSMATVLKAYSSFYDF